MPLSKQILRTRSEAPERAFLYVQGPVDAQSHVLQARLATVFRTWCGRKRPRSSAVVAPERLSADACLECLRAAE